MVVDSCLDRSTGRPAALDYLESLNADLNRVVLVIATHWHDDHIGGLSQILESCSRAKFGCPAALRTREFGKLLAAGEDAMLASTSGVDEFLAINRLSKARRTRGVRPEVSFPDHWVTQDMRLLRQELNKAGLTAEVWSLSPCPAAMTAAMLEFGRLSVPTGPIRRLLSTDNQVCAVIWVQVGNVRVLLGADLEDHGREREGWRAVLESTARPHGKAHLFKVPHHGSPNADVPEVWSELLVEAPIAVVAPYWAGRRPRPDDSDLRRLCHRTEYVFVTGKRGGPKRRDPLVDRTAGSVSKNRVTVQGPVGHIRVRFDEQGRPTSYLKNGAFRACQ